MRSSTYRKYINSMRLKTADLPEYGYIGLHFTMTWVTDRSELRLPGHVLKMEGGSSRLIIVDPSFYKNRDELIAYLARMYTGMADNTLKVYALPNADTVVDLVSMAYQEISSAYIYKLWLASVKNRRTTPTFPAVVATLAADSNLIGWKNASVAAIDSVAAFPALRSKDVRIAVAQTLASYEDRRRRAEKVDPKLIKAAASLPSEIKMKVSTRMGKTEGVTVSKDTTPPTVHPIPDGFSVNKLTKEALMLDLKTAPKPATPRPNAGRTTKKKAIEKFMRSKRNMLQAIREHENVVMLVKDLITK